MRKQLSAERRLFGAVSGQAAAEKLGEAGNVIQTGENAQVAASANQGILLYDKLSTKTGPIAQALDSAAQSLADGENGNDVKQRAYRQIRSLLREQADRLAGGPRAGSGEPEGGGTGRDSEAGAGEHGSAGRREPASVSPLRQESGGAPETGPHGPIWREYSGKPAEAIAKLQQEERGEVPRVWRNEDLARATNTDGWIGLIWGDLKGGLAHIVDKHVIRQKDLKLEDLAEMIPRMRVAGNDGRSVVLESDTHRATVRLSYDDVEKRWLVTAFEKRPSTGESPTGPGSPNRGGGPVIAPPNGPSVPPPPERSGGAPDSSVAPGGGAVNRVDPLLGTHVEPSAVRQFSGDETGTSLVGSILKADAKEALALKAKRDAALAEVEKAKGTPGEQRFGQKTIHYFTGERDLWSARVNQVIARLRKMVPDHVEQEAISLMRDFKGREQELTQFLAGTHPGSGADS